MPTTHRKRTGGAARFIDPKVLGRIDDLELLARTVVDGFVAGLHQSPHLGLSLDFAEHRAYMPGDDIRHIDWRLFARTDRFYVKRYEAETNANIMLAVDVSASMGYASDGVSKLDYARFLGAALAYLSGRQRDRVGMVTFDARPRESVPPAVRHVDRVLLGLDRSEAEGEGDLPEAIARVGSGLRRRGIVVLMSDLYADPDRILEAARALHFRGQDVLVFHILDPSELELPFQEPAIFRNVETGRSIPVVPEDARGEYKERLERHIQALERGLTGNRMDYLLLDTSRPLDHALFRYLGTRRELSRVR